MTAFSRNDISVLPRPKNVIFGTKVVSSMRMICTLRFMEKVLLLWQKNAKKYTKNANFTNAVAHWRHMYAETAYTWRHRVKGFYTHVALRIL